MAFEEISFNSRSLYRGEGETHSFKPIHLDDDNNNNNNNFSEEKATRG